MVKKRTITATLASLVVIVALQGASVHIALATSGSANPNACLGIDANGDGVIDDLPDPGSNCIVVPLMIEPKKPQPVVDLSFKTVHAGFPTSDSFDPSTIIDKSLSFGDADSPENRANPPVDKRCKWAPFRDKQYGKICKWTTGKAGIHAGDTSACVTGVTGDGRKIEGCARLTTMN